MHVYWYSGATCLVKQLILTVENFSIQVAARKLQFLLLQHNQKIELCYATLILKLIEQTEF